MSNSTKKSVNFDDELLEKAEELVEQNSGVTFSFIANQALRKWLEDPSFEIVVADKDKAMKTAKKVMKKHKHALKKLS